MDIADVEENLFAAGDAKVYELEATRAGNPL